MISKNKLLAVCDSRCGYCGKKISLFNMQIDYVLPERFGGTKTTDNALPVCRECKKLKEDKPLESFRSVLNSRTGKNIRFYFEIRRNY